MAKSSGSGAHQQMSLDLLPSALLATVMTKLDIASIRSLACTCIPFMCLTHAFASFLVFISSRGAWVPVNPVTPPAYASAKLVCSYQDIAPPAEYIRPLLPPNPYLRSLKVDCTRLDDSSLDCLLQPTLQEQGLHNCADFSGRLLSQVGQYCKDLRFLYLSSLAEKRGRSIDVSDLEVLFGGCTQLEVRLLESVA